MSLRARVARNVLWNWVGLGTGMVAGVLVAPFLVQRLGDTVYGVWVLIASVTGYFGLLDLGTRGAVGRNIAFFRAKGDREGENAILSTGAAILGGIACLTLCATFLVAVLFFRLFTVPPEEVSGARLALQLVGINVAVTLALSVFDALLWA